MPAYESSHLALSYSGSFPDHIKLLKTINAGPLEVTAVGTVNPRTNDFGYCLGIRDTLIGGRVSYNRAKNAIEYK